MGESSRQKAAWFGGCALGCCLLLSLPVSEAQGTAAAPMRAHPVALPALYGPLGVTPDAVRQGQLGTCYFHAAVAAIAAHRGALLEAAISDLGHGQYVVRFADGMRETVYQEDLVYARQKRFDLSDGLWVAVLFRGFAQRTLKEALLRSVAGTTWSPGVKSTAVEIVSGSEVVVLAYDRAIREVVRQDGAIDKKQLRTALAEQATALNVSPLFSGPVLDFLDEQGFFNVLTEQIAANGELFGAYRAVGQGGLPTRVMRAFGLRAQNSRLLAVRADQDGVERFEQGRSAMIVTTAPTPQAAWIAGMPARALPVWWVSSHAYAVLHYDAATDTVRLRNPWGSHPEPDGDFSVTRADFLAAFADLDAGS